jgi:hypothetical protein
MRFTRRSLPRGAVVLTAVAVLVAAVVATPSLAGSFLTKQAARNLFLSRKDARKTYLRQDKPSSFDPTAASASSNVQFGPVQTATGTQVPASSVTFKLKQPGLAVLTFSGAATCTALTDGVPCPILLQVDAQNVSTGKANFALSTSAASPQPEVHTVVQTVFLQKGIHVATVFYAGSSNSSLNFKLSNWNLIAQGYPGT